MAMSRKKKIILAAAAGGTGLVVWSLMPAKPPMSAGQKQRITEQSFDVIRAPEASKTLTLPGQTAEAKPVEGTAEKDIYLSLDPTSISNGLAVLHVRYMPVQALIENGNFKGMGFSMFQYGDDGKVVHQRYGINFANGTMQWGGVDYPVDIATALKDMKTETVLSAEGGIERVLYDNGTEKKTGLRDQQTGAVTQLLVPTEEDLALYQKASDKDRPFQSANKYLMATQHRPEFVYDTVYTFSKEQPRPQIFTLGKDAKTQTQTVLRVKTDGKVELGKVELLKNNLYTPLPDKPNEDQMDMLRFNRKFWQDDYTRQSRLPTVPAHFALAAQRVRTA